MSNNVIEKFAHGFGDSDDGEDGILFRRGGNVWVRQADGTESLVGGGGSVPDGGWYFKDVQFDEPEPWTTYPITAVDTDAGTFTIAGDHRDDYPAGSLFGVAGSTGNDNFYHVDSVVFATGSTTIGTANGWIPTDPTADGGLVKSLVAVLPIPAGSTVQDLRAIGVVAFNNDADTTFQIGDSRDQNAYSGAGDPAEGEARIAPYDPAVASAPSMGNYVGHSFSPSLYTQGVFVNEGAGAADGVHYPDGDDITCRVVPCISAAGGSGQVILRFLISAPTAAPIVAT